MFAISIAVCIVGVVLGLIFRLVAMLRLSVPLLYALVVGFFFPVWANTHQALSMSILYGLLGLCVLSWILTLIRKIRCYRMQREYERIEEERLLAELLRKQGIAD
ncbi:MAG: hypothetical protein DBX40_00240 [Clostridiales bacterium]|jgi:uncharacterized membrane protein YeaQ/YmgE (transglycosylase-associated protein family)|nr:MAG: hypothetical protein DBX40_00240 [Clostridiales bacterium]